MCIRDRVSLIETEKLLSDMVAAKLNKWKDQGKYNGSFSVGRNKLKNASILREYGSIGMGEKTKDYCRLLSRISRRMVGSLSLIHI